MKEKSAKYLGAILGAFVAGAVLVVGATKVVYPAISELVGLSVAQSATMWNSVADAAKGDALANGVLAQAPMVFNGLTFDRVRGDITNGMDVDVTRISGSLTPSDAFANPTNVSNMWSLNSVFNGSTWDRMRSATGDSLSTGVAAMGQMLFNGSTLDRERTASGDNLAATGIPASGNMGFDGSTWDRLVSVSGTNNTATTTQGVRYYTPLSTWSVTNTPAANTQATVTKAAGGTTVRHVATSITACFVGTVTAAPVQINLRDGASGAGTILRTWFIGIPTANGGDCVNLSGLNITGSANTAMTLEFVAAGGANTNETVTLTGYSTP